MNDTQLRAILTALEAVPLDRLRLMKALFLAWHHGGRPENWIFRFEPYLYGPCAFDVYRGLDALSENGYVVQVPEAHKHGNYYITAAGRSYLEGSEPLADATGIREYSKWAAGERSFSALLNRVYAEAPDFAEQSVVAGRLGR